MRLTMRFIRLIFLFISFFLVCLPVRADAPPDDGRAAGSYAQRPEVQVLIDELVSREHYDRATLEQAFTQVRRLDRVIGLVAPPPPGTPAAAKDWPGYRQRFVEAHRIADGVAFWRQYRDDLARAEAEFGVPAFVIVGILGAETIYGRQMGNFRVIDTLTTLAFDYPEAPNRASRSQMFRAQLADYLLWCRDTGRDLFASRGSYAGAMGMPQFMPSSVRRYAVNFSGGKRADLQNSAVDAIGSVANFLRQHGWEPARPVLWQINMQADSLAAAAAAATGDPEPGPTLAELRARGLVPGEAVDLEREAQTRVVVVDLPAVAAPTQYRLGLQNFYVLTRYNRSFFYATAVYELGRAVEAALRDGAPAVAKLKRGKSRSTGSGRRGRKQ